MNDEKPRWPLSVWLGSVVARLVLAALITAKVLAENDVSVRFLDDPIELWVAMGVAYLLLAFDPPPRRFP